jgi:hypothetical protein
MSDRDDPLGLGFARQHAAEFHQTLGRTARAGQIHIDPQGISNYYDTKSLELEGWADTSFGT